MEIDVKDIIARNIKSLRKKYGISLQELSTQIGIAKSTLSNFENGKTTPSIEVLYNLCGFFQINMSIFVSEYLNENDIFIQDGGFPGKSDSVKNIFHMYNKYTGTYIIYYYKSESQLTTAKLILRNHKNRLIAEAFFDAKAFEGHLSIVGRHTYISLTGTTHFEKVLIVLHDPPSLKTYVGGIGVMASVSSGRIQCPCAKKIILSENELPDLNEIKSLLSLIEKNVVNIEEAVDDRVYHLIKG